MSDRPSRPSGASGSAGGSPGARRPGRAGARPGAGFDRIKAPSSGERTRPDGRAALFGEPASGSATETPPPREAPSGSASGSAGARAVTIAGVHCQACGATSPLDLLTAVRGLVPLVLVPWADHPWWAVCPACGQRTWLRPEVLGIGA